MVKLALDFARSFLGFGRSRVLLAAVLVLATAVLDGLGILLLVPVLDMVMGQPQTDLAREISRAAAAAGLTQPAHLFMASVGGFLFLLALRGLLIWFRDVRIATLSLAFIDGWRTKVFQALAESPWSTTGTLKRADIEHALISDISRMAVGTDRIIRGAGSLAILLAQAAIAFALSPALTLIVLASVSVAALLFTPLIVQARRLGERLTVAGQAVFALLGHFLSGLKLAKVHGAEKPYVEQYGGTLADVREQMVAFTAKQSATRALFQFLAGALACLVIAIGVFALATPTAILAVFLLILARLTGPVLSLLQAVQAFANMLPAFGNVRKLLTKLEKKPDEESPAPSRHDALPSHRQAVQHHNLVELHNVSFRHNGQSAPVLQDITLEIRPGEFIGLVGPSGAGKTTLADIVTGLLQPASGSVVAAGVKLDDASIAAWRTRIAYVPQEPFLFDMTIRENLEWATRNASDDAIWKALEIAGAKGLVEALPNRLDTRVGERGQSLSGGERQRLCLARALVRNPELLILDEATNALDSATETLIIERLARDRNAMTILMITHREASLAVADRVIEIADGNATEITRSVDASEVAKP
jgi:ATP-binding cassette, subfamily C, bacterial